MALEIEHKYLVTNDSFIALASRSVEMAQGYLSRDPERTVRVRIADKEAFLTVKGRSKGAVREEFEYKIPLEDAEAMLSLCEGKVIRKCRYYVEYDGFTWEIDKFKEDLAPLILAEIELPSDQTEYTLPPFVGKDVTGDVSYYNSTLSKE